MSYQQANIPLPESLAEAYSDALMEHGALSSAIEDACAGTDDEQPIFGEPDMPLHQVWQQSRIIALFDDKADVQAALEAAAKATGIAMPEYTVEILAEQDWVRLTQSQFDPIQISERPHGTKRPTKPPSTCGSTRAWHSARAATPPRICACNGWTGICNAAKACWTTAAAPAS